MQFVESRAGGCGVDGNEARRSDGRSLLMAGPGGNDDYGIAAEVERTRCALHATLSDGMEVAADDQRDTAGHRGDRRHEPVMLLEPVTGQITNGRDQAIMKS